VISAAWGLVEEVIRGLGPSPAQWVYLAEALAVLVAGVALIRGRLWGYVATVALWLLGIVQAVWVFFIEGAEREAAGPVGFGVITLMAVPLAFLLSRRATTWAGNAWKSRRQGEDRMETPPRAG